MLFDTKLQKHDITYTKEDPKMINYLEEIININNKYQNKFIELREDMSIIRKRTIVEDTKYQFYAECVIKHISDITEEICNFSEDINNLYDKFSNSYSSLSESENNILENINKLMLESLFFNGYVYNVSLDHVNLDEDMLVLKDTVIDERFLKLYIEEVNSDDHYNIIRGKLLNLNEKFTNEEYINYLNEKMLLHEGKKYSARLTKNEKENLLESVLNNESLLYNSNKIINSINNHYCNVIDYFNEMANLEMTKLNEYMGYHILADAKLIECANVLSIYNETLGIYLDAVNKQNKEYSDFFNEKL